MTVDTPGTFGGLPKRRADHSIDDDVRKWPMFERAVLHDGKLVPDSMTFDKGVYKRPDSTFRDFVTEAGGDGKFPAESGRYWLFVSGVCPWANGCRTLRALLGLEECIPMEICDGQSNGGWVKLDGTKCPPWTDRPGPWFAHEAYIQSDPHATCRITMPVLYDTKTQKIVNTESSEIMRMLGTVFKPFAKTWHDFFPKHLEKQAELLCSMIYPTLCNGVYRAGFGLKSGGLDAYEAAKEDVFRCLDSLETRLQRNRYLLGPEMTYVDIRVVMCLLRFDLAYYNAFAVNNRRIADYPNLSGFVADIYSQIHKEVDWASFYQYFRWGPAHPKLAALPNCRTIIDNLSKQPSRSKMAPHRGQKRHRGIPIPFWFQPESVAAFENLNMKQSDVVFGSLPKAGTHLVKQAILCILRLSDEGVPPSADGDWDMKHDGYIEMYPLEKNPNAKPGQKFQDKSFADIVLAQPDPRMLVTHTTPLFGWPDLSSSKFVYSIRNPKDTCTSLYYMFGVPADGWEGAYNRYISADCHNAFGSYFEHVYVIDKYVREHLGGWKSGRVHVVYFEDMVNDREGQLHALADFLGVSLGDKKLSACVERTSFGNMKDRKFGAGRMDKNFFRKGEIGDWKRHFTKAQNVEFDRITAERLKDCEVMAPYMPGGRLYECISGEGTDSPCWLEADHEEQKSKAARL